METKEKQVIERILKFCGFDYTEIKSPQKGYRNTSYPVLLKDKTTINIILFKNEQGIVERIKQADKLSDALADKGFPTRRSLSEIIMLKDSHITRYARCYSYLPGKTIPWEAYTMKHIKLLGQTMAKLHQASSKMTLKGDVVEECVRLSKQMNDYFNRLGVREALNNKLKLNIEYSHDSTKTYLMDSDLLILPSQALHMDFVRGNVLFSEQDSPEISGIIDFEKASNGPVIFDIARTLAFLLVDCRFKDSNKVYKYFIKSGYIKRGNSPLDTKQLQLMSRLTRFYLMYDFYKFLKHTPYESLKENMHFIRTRDFLIRDGMIDYVEYSKP